MVTPDGFLLVTCHRTLHYKQKTEIKPKLFTDLKMRDSKKALPRTCPVFFFQVSFKLIVQVRATKPMFSYSLFIDLVQHVENLICCPTPRHILNNIHKYVEAVISIEEKIIETIGSPVIYAMPGNAKWYAICSLNDP